MPYLRRTEITIDIQENLGLLAFQSGNNCSDQVLSIHTADSYGDYTVPGLLVTFVESQQC